jgi:multiple sugar transport system permease protein
LCFSNPFNEFLFALALTSTPDAETVLRGVSILVGPIDTDWAAMRAGGVLATLPIVVLAVLVQRHLVRGLRMGAVK